MTNKYTRLNQWRIAVCESDLHKTTKCVLLVMSVKFMDEELYCFPSQRLLAKFVGCTWTTVNTHIRKAKETGWLDVKSETGAKQGWRRNDYYGFIPVVKSSYRK